MNMIAQSLAVLVVVVVVGAAAGDALRHNDRPFAGVDPNTLSCDPRGLEELLLPHREDCTLFYQCVHGREVPRACARPLIFDFEIQNCNWERETTCVLRNPDGGGGGHESGGKSDESGGKSDESGGKSDESGGGQGSGKPFEGVDPNTLSCDPEGQIFLLLPHHSDCTRYYQCANGREVLMPACPHPLIFDFELQGCNWEWDARCILRTPEGEESEENKKSSEEKSNSTEEDGDNQSGGDGNSSATDEHSQESSSESNESGGGDASGGSDSGEHKESDQQESESQDNSKDVTEESKESGEGDNGHSASDENSKDVTGESKESGEGVTEESKESGEGDNGHSASDEENSGDSDENEGDGDQSGSDEENSGDSADISEGSGESDETGEDNASDENIEGSGSGDGSGDFEELEFDLSEPQVNVDPLDILARLATVVRSLRPVSKHDDASHFSAILDCRRADSASRHVAHRTDCQRFWRCVSGVPQTFYCSDGLFFNERSQQCDFESNVRCLAAQDDELDGEFIVYN